MNKKKSLEIVCLAAALAVVAGCAKKAPVKPEPTPTPVVEKVDANVNYVVKPGDSLWKIANSDSVMGDPFRWPLLYKANRDQIQDPDLIEPKQDLQFKKQYNESEVTDAVKKAKVTPPYAPHSTPRKSLPVKY
jgi:hypothetical protein